MADVALPPIDHARPANWTVVIFGLLIIALLAFVPLTMTFLQSLDSDALLVDLAGRQRMLLERQMKELLLSVQGVPSAYDQTRRTLGERLDTLLNGGTVIVHGDRQPVTLTGPPSVEIRVCRWDTASVRPATAVAGDAQSRRIPVRRSRPVNETFCRSPSIRGPSKKNAEKCCINFPIPET